MNLDIDIFKEKQPNLEVFISSDLDSDFNYKSYFKNLHNTLDDYKKLLKKYEQKLIDLFDFSDIHIDSQPNCVSLYYHAFQVRIFERKDNDIDISVSIRYEAYLDEIEEVEKFKELSKNINKLDEIIENKKDIINQYCRDIWVSLTVISYCECNLEKENNLHLYINNPNTISLLENIFVPYKNTKKLNNFSDLLKLVAGQRMNFLTYSLDKDNLSIETTTIYINHMNNNGSNKDCDNYQVTIGEEDFTPEEAVEHMNKRLFLFNDKLLFSFEDLENELAFLSEKNSNIDNFKFNYNYGWDLYTISISDLFNIFNTIPQYKMLFNLKDF